MSTRARLEKNLDEAICSQKMMTNFLNPTQSYKPKGLCNIATSNVLPGTTLP